MSKVLDVSSQLRRSVGVGGGGGKANLIKRADKFS